MKNKLRINMLGALHVQLGDETAEFRTDALRVLLTYLAAHQGAPQRRDTLAGLLSPDRPDKEALTYLRNRLTRLRNALRDPQATPPWFEIDRKQLMLRTGDDIEIDLTRFEQHLTVVEHHAHRDLARCPTCLAHLQKAVNLVRGEFLSGLSFPSDLWEGWLTTQREHIRVRMLATMRQLREARIALAEWDAVQDIALRELRFEPWLEEAHRALMQAYYYLGDKNAALAQYEVCERQLRDELGVEPEEATNRLQQQIANAALSLPDQTEFPDNLPLQTGPFFGREAEQATLLSRLVDPNYRLVTIVGPGGIGKTRLSLEVARQVKANFPDGVWFVPLDAVKGGAEQVKIAVGEALGFAQNDKQLSGEQVLAILRNKQALLLFDNSEVKLDEIAFIPTWLKRAPHIAILATSREPLNFLVESTVMLNGLPIGLDATGAAEAMFAERGHMAREDFHITNENLPLIQQICTLVDGSPLAIALAAAWVRRRSLAQIADSIARSLDFLSTRMRDIDLRHRSMRAVLETSWELLTADEKIILARLSVFPSTFAAAAAKHIADGLFDELDSLCEKSLLHQQQEAERYSMHSLVRQYAFEKLSANAVDVELRFVDYFYQYARTNKNDYPQLRPEWHNFSGAIRKAHQYGAWRSLLDFVELLDEPWFRQIRFTEMREGLSLALAATSALDDELAEARVTLRLGEVAVEQSDYPVAERHLSRALAHYLAAENGRGIANSQYLLGRTALEQGHDDQTIALCHDSINNFKGMDDKLGIAKNLNLLALCQIRKFGDYQTAYTKLEQSISLQRQVPPTPIYVETLRHLARVSSVQKELDTADKQLVEATEVALQLKDIGEYAAVLYERVLLCKKNGHIAEALAHGYNALENFTKLGSLRWEALLKTQLGLLYQTKQNRHRALDLLNDGLQIFIELGDRYEQAYSYYYLHRLHAELGDTKQSVLSRGHASRLNKLLGDQYLAELIA